MIEIKNVHKYFNRGKRNEIHVINDISLSLPDSGLVALLGESGCGKTTMLNAIGGLDKIRKGKIYINGKKISSRFSPKVDKIRNLNVGYIFQDYKLMDDMTVFDNVALALKLVGIKDKKEVKERVEYVLDKVGILRYRYRPASTLSGGERQRVGIARALVKNPDIILADEPTGNLDSRNSVEIMNIIKKISKDRLVILVTHERPLAKFYASRIIELVDGKVKADYENTSTEALDYEIGNVFYLKEFEKEDTLTTAGGTVKVYSDTDEKMDISLVVKNGNIYIKSNRGGNIEVVDDHSSIEMVDDFKKEIVLDNVEEYDYDMSAVGNQNLKRRYSSIYNPVTALIQGFRKVFGFSVLKKILLAGFLFAGIFVVYSVGRVAAIYHVVDSDFIEYNRNYVMLEKKFLSADEITRLEEESGASYILPNDGMITLKLKADDYYQTQWAEFNIRGSLAALETIEGAEAVYGRLPENEKEIMIDLSLGKKVLSSNEMIMAGVDTYEEILGRTLFMNNNRDKLPEYTVVGIVDTGNPSIYAFKSEMLNLMRFSAGGNEWGWEGPVYYDVKAIGDEGDDVQLTDYMLYKDQFSLTKNSKLPVNDFEVLLPESMSSLYKLGKETDMKVDGIKLKVSGFYKNSNLNGRYVTENTIKIQTMKAAESYVLYCDGNKDEVLSYLVDQNGYIAYDTFARSRENYDDGREAMVKETALLGLIFILISLVEIYLIIRSSFLSRIKEVGILRAIGTKKRDIYKMFLGEIVAISILTTLPAMYIMYRVEGYITTSISYLASTFYMPVPLLIASILFVFIFNAVVGLLPVYFTMRKRPAAILARYDVD